MKSTKLLCATLVLGLAVCSATSAAAATPQVDGTGDLEGYLARYGELAEDVWQFQLAGKDLCQSSQVWLPGVFFSPIGNAETASGQDEQPLSVERVFAGGPAAAAGLLHGDEILEINGEDVVGRSWRGEAKWDATWQEVIAEDEPVEFTIRRGGVTKTITVTPIAACDVRLVYTRQKIPAPRQQGMVMIDGMIDEVANEPWQRRAFLAPEVALTMNSAQTRENTAKRWAGRLANVVAATTGFDVGAAQFVVNLKMTKETRLKGDRIGLYLLARIGDDVTRVPGFWKSVYDYPTDGHWSSTFFGIRPTLAERQAVFDTALADIARQQAAGQALDPGR